MIVLDTNVLSALMQSSPARAVIEWLDRQPAESVWTTAVTIFEVRFGIELLRPGKRRRALETAFQLALFEDLDGRILVFDRAAALVAGHIAAERRRTGRSVEVRDTQIAAIVLERRASLATRNVRHFRGLGLKLVDPWAA